MTAAPQPTALTATVISQDVYVYMSDENGCLTEAHGSVSGQNKEPAPWTRAGLGLFCSPSSTLCGISWDSFTQSIFYQDDKGFIREWRKLDRWVDVGLIELRGLTGTSISVVHCANGNKAMLFYQDEDRFVCCCNSRFKRWYPPFRIARAAKRSGISATAWDGLTSVRLYFQDESFAIREYVGSQTSTLCSNRKFPPTLVSPRGVISITAISRMTGEIRLYVKDNDDGIVELAMNDGKWCKSETHPDNRRDHCIQTGSILGTGLVALSLDRGSNMGWGVDLIWAANQNIHRCSFTGLEWTDSQILSVVDALPTSSSELFGLSGTESRFVRAVSIRVLNDTPVRIGAVVLESSDGAKSPMQGSDAGVYERFPLKDGEDIVYMWTIHESDSKVLQGLRFGTSSGRQSSWFGSKGYNDSIKNMWSGEEHPLLGFDDRRVSDTVMDLKPLWAPQTVKIDTCTDAGKFLQLAFDVDKLRMELDHFKSLLGSHPGNGKPEQRSIELLPPKDDPLDGHKISDLVRTLEYFYDINRPTHLEYNERRRETIETQRLRCIQNANNVKASLLSFVKNIYQDALELTANAQDISSNIACELASITPDSEELQEKIKILKTAAGLVSKEAQEAERKVWASQSALSALCDEFKGAPGAVGAISESLPLPQCARALHNIFGFVYKEQLLKAYFLDKEVDYDRLLNAVRLVADMD